MPSRHDKMRAQYEIAKVGHVSDTSKENKVPRFQTRHIEAEDR
jgi:hypothetical protein